MILLQHNFQQPAKLLIRFTKSLIITELKYKNYRV